MRKALVETCAEDESPAHYRELSHDNGLEIVVALDVDSKGLFRDFRVPISAFERPAGALLGMHPTRSQAGSARHAKDRHIGHDGLIGAAAGLRGKRALLLSQAAPRCFFEVTSVIALP